MFFISLFFFALLLLLEFAILFQFLIWLDQVLALALGIPSRSIQFFFLVVVF